MATRRPPRILLLRPETVRGLRGRDTSPMPEKRSHRRAARRRAFQILYGFHFEAPEFSRDIERAVRRAPQDPNHPDPDDDYTLTLVRGVWERTAELDALVAAHSQNWKLARIARIELTILRLALYEMLHQPEIPLRVALNEAVELAKNYGDDNSPPFINGILDAAAKAVDQGKLGQRKPLAKTPAKDDTP